MTKIIKYIKEIFKSKISSFRRFSHSRSSVFIPLIRHADIHLPIDQAVSSSLVDTVVNRDRHLYLERAWSIIAQQVKPFVCAPCIVYCAGIMKS